MFKKSSEMNTEIREKMRGGDGEVRIQNIFNPEELKGKSRMFSKVTLNPGCSIGSHAHDNEEEIYYILSGTGIADDNGQLINISAGDAIKTGGGESHSITNNGSEPLVFIAAILLFN